MELNLRRVCLHLQSKWVGIIAIKTERTQIHLFSDVLVAVAPLDLKVSNNASLFAMKLDKSLVRDKITTLSNRFVSHA